MILHVADIEDHPQGLPTTYLSHKSYSSLFISFLLCSHQNHPHCAACSLSRAILRMSLEPMCPFLFLAGRRDRVEVLAGRRYRSKESRLGDCCWNNCAVSAACRCAP